MLVVWLGIFLFLYGTDKRLKDIENELGENFHKKEHN
ncbi:MAG: CcmD family protein [bacterium]